LNVSQDSAVTDLMRDDKILFRLLLL